MRDQYEYIINSQASYNGPIRRAFHTAYNSNDHHFSFSIPEETGNGQFSRMCGSRGIRFLNFDMNFHKPIEVQGISKIPHLDMLFCLGNSLSWELPHARKEFALCSGESYMGISCETTKNTVYPERCDIRFMEVKMPLVEITDTLSEIQRNCNRHCHTGNSVPFGKFKITPSIQIILNQLLNCPYQDSLKQLYLEGKLLELLAVYFNEAVYQTQRIPENVNLSAQDIQSLYRAKEILDNEISETPTHRQLSKLVSLNEFKLKKGFKELFDVPIHTYVINQRLELAKALLDEKQLSVSQVAARAGYGNMSHFAAAFRGKYGMNPGSYLQSIKK